MDRKQKKKKGGLSAVISTVIMMLIGALIGVLSIIHLEGFFDGDVPLHILFLAIAALVIGIYVAMLFHLVVHEAGHLLFGLMTGYEFTSFRIGSFMWVREDGKVRLKRLAVVGTGGQCLMTPPAIKDGKMPFMLYNFGGVLLNIILGALFLVGYFFCPAQSFFAPLLIVFSIGGFVVAATNGIPMRMGPVDNDGYNARAIRKSPAAVEAFWIQLTANGELAKGVSLREMPDEWFTMPTDEEMKNSIVATRGVLACNRSMEEKRFDEADAMIAHLLAIESGTIDLYRDLLTCDRLYIELIGENRAESIERLLTDDLQKFMKTMCQFPSVLRVKYALALLSQKNVEEAEKIKEQFEMLAKSYPFVTDIQAERELMAIAADRSAT